MVHAQPGGGAVVIDETLAPDRSATAAELPSVGALAYRGLGGAVAVVGTSAVDAVVDAGSATCATVAGAGGAELTGRAVGAAGAFAPRGIDAAAEHTTLRGFASIVADACGAAQQRGNVAVGRGGAQPVAGAGRGVAAQSRAARTWVAGLRAPSSRDAIG